MENLTSTNFNRTNDFFFKYLLGSAKNKAISLSFINAALGTSKEYFTDIVFLDKDQDPQYEGDKQSRLDLKGVLNTGDIIEIEMQVVHYDYMSERSLYYWACMYSQQLAAGEDYEKLKRSTAINVLNFAHLPETNWVNSYRLLNTESKKALTEHLQIVFLELPKLASLTKNEVDIKNMSSIEQWGAYFTRLVDDKKLEGIPMLAAAMEAEKVFTADEIMRYKYQQREKFLRDQLSLKNSKEKAEKRAAEAEKKNLRNILDFVAGGYIPVEVGAAKAEMSVVALSQALEEYKSSGTVLEK